MYLQLNTLLEGAGGSGDGARYNTHERSRGQY